MTREHGAGTDRRDNAILVTGATGNVGRAVVAELQRRGAPVRAAALAMAEADAILGNDIDRVPFDFARPETFGPAFAGARALFLLRPPDITDTRRVIVPALTAAERAGVEHVVFLSLLGAERNRIVPHAAIEKALLASGMRWTFLRASFFMQNLNTTHRADIREHGDIFVPAGRGRTSFIDARDIAAVAALVLTEPGHEERVYPLTGSAALSYAEVAAILTEALGRPIRYSNPSPMTFAARMRRRGYPWAFILVMLGIYTTCKLGLAAGVTPDTERLLGRPPITMRQYVEDYQEAWM